MPSPKKQSWTVTAKNNRDRTRDLTGPNRGPFFATVIAPSADEQVLIDSFVGQRRTSFAYPFASASAWIRGQPEATTTMLATLGGDSRDVTPIAYFDKQKTLSAVAYGRVQATLRSDPQAEVPATLPYRQLEPGELDLGSKFAQTFLGKRDVHQSRGGLSHFTMSSRSAVVDTPLMSVRGPAHRHTGALSDEQRFGVVRRATPATNPTFPALIRGPGVSTRNVAAPFAKEHSTILSWFGNPGKLLDFREGIVVEDGGGLATSPASRLNLRSRKRWYSSLSFTEREIDEAGNVSWTLAQTALDGMSVNVPTGSLAWSAGRTATLRATQDVNVSSSLGNLVMSGAQGFRLSTTGRGNISATLGLNLQSTGVVSVDSPIPAGIQLGSRAAVKYPVLVGNTQYLTTLGTWLSGEVGFLASAAAYGAAASAAWGAAGPLLAILDPTATVASLCLAAAAAGTAMNATATTAAAALGAHLPTLGPSPAGFLSTKVVSE